VFGVDIVRPEQEEAICKVVSGASVFVQLPTGHGKSLVYQCSGVLMQGITLVVSPLVALIQAQLHALHQRHVNAMSLDKVFSEGSRAVGVSRRDNTEPAFWYGTPESVIAYQNRLQSNDIRRLVKLLVFDEVHCLHLWGLKFRPSYLACAQWLRFTFPDLPVVALTATATPSTRHGIEEALLWQSEQYEVVHRSSLRLNLQLTVTERRSKYGDENYFGEVSDVVLRQSGTGIVYCATRAETDSMAKALQERGMRCLSYRAGQDVAARSAAQDAWMRGEVRVMCCTVAFGMGINKPDVRFVVHACLPTSIERYAQEIGRAGRDNSISRCILMYNRDDALKVRHMWMDQHSPVDLRNIDIMQTFVEDRARCRHVLLSRCLGDRLGGEEKHCANACDNCERRQPFTLRNVEKFASLVVDLVPFLLQYGLCRRSEMMPVLRGRIRTVTRSALFNGRFPAADLLYLKLEQEAAREQEDTIHRVLLKLFAYGVLKEDGPGRSVTSYGDRWSRVKPKFCHLATWQSEEPSKAVAKNRGKRAQAENEDRTPSALGSVDGGSATNQHDQLTSLAEDVVPGSNGGQPPSRKKVRQQRVCCKPPS
jgi:RecQ family ATP-dependent DNA helicase